MSTSGNHPFRRHRLVWSQAALALILSGTILVSGTSPALGSSTRSTGKSSQTTLTIQNLSFMGKQVAPVIAGFEKRNPNVTVSVQSITAGQFNSNLVQLSSNNPPDVGWVPINRPVYTQLLKANDLVPLGDVWKAADLQKRYGATYAASISGGSTPYVVAIDYIYYDVLIYNRTLFAKLGIPEPVNHRFSSFAELAQDVSKLKAAGYAGIANSGNNGYASAALVDGYRPRQRLRSSRTISLTGIRKFRSRPSIPTLRS
jgi:ABC-type glycerol-3-phosphate transport system substrate-binding protein